MMIIYNIVLLLLILF